MAPPTILAIKQNFLTGQTRLLSQPLAPSRSWRQANEESDDAISAKALDDALVRLNHTLQQHVRRHYAPQASRHVAEQIDQLYWDAGERAIDASQRSGVEGLGRGVDMTESETILSLPHPWESERDINAHPMEAKRYADLVTRLQELNAQRTQVRENVQRLRHLHEILEPFRDGPGVQSNLVTRDGEVEKELERMRVLLARVGGRVGHLLEQQPADQDTNSLFRDGDSMIVDDVEVDERRKVNDLLDRF